MKKKLTILCAVAVMICTCLTGCGVNAGKIRFGSAGIGGTYQVFGDTFANLVTSKSKNYNIEVKTTAGSAANLRLLSKDYIQMAVAQMDLINDAYERTGIFEMIKNIKDIVPLLRFILKRVRLSYLLIHQSILLKIWKERKSVLVRKNLEQNRMLYRS